MSIPSWSLPWSLPRSLPRRLLVVSSLLLVLAGCEKRERSDDPSRRGGAGAAVPGVPAVPPGVGVNADTQTLGSPYGAQDNTKPPPRDDAPGGAPDAGMAGMAGGGGAPAANGSAAPAGAKEAAAGAGAKK